MQSREPSPSHSAVGCLAPASGLQIRLRFGIDKLPFFETSNNSDLRDLRLSESDLLRRAAKDSGQTPRDIVRDGAVDFAMTMIGWTRSTEERLAKAFSVLLESGNDITPTFLAQAAEPTAGYRAARRYLEDRGLWSAGTSAPKTRRASTPPLHVSVHFSTEPMPLFIRSKVAALRTLSLSETDVILRASQMTVAKDPKVIARRGAVSRAKTLISWSHSPSQDDGVALLGSADDRLEKAVKLLRSRGEKITASRLAYASEPIVGYYTAQRWMRRKGLAK